MADAFPGRLRRTLIATAAVVLLGSAGATCGLIVRAVPGEDVAGPAARSTPVAAAEAQPAQVPVRTADAAAETTR